MSTFSQDPRTLGAKSISLDSEFAHNCMLCGNCCRGRSNQMPGTDIFLSGPDLQRMSAFLGMTNCQFIDQHAVMYFDVEKGLTLCRLRMRFDGTCSLLKKGKCQAYSARPRTCALYPLGRGIQFWIQGSKVMSAPDTYCINRPETDYMCGAEKTYTVKQWLALNEIPINDSEDKRWFKRLVELSIESVKLNKGQTVFQRQAFYDLYINWNSKTSSDIVETKAKTVQYD